MSCKVGFDLVERVFGF